MKKYRKTMAIFPLVVISIPILLFTPKAIAGSFGAEIFCTMRDGGNDHESSWQAAYSYIKKQKGGIFKTSPKQAAGQIIETVVREREKFSYCVEYLDQLHPDRKLQLENNRKEKKRKQEELMKEKESKDYSEETFDRYSY
ncbi:secretion system protein [Prochlorococcus sp. AH-716-K03]|nr:secretion system protein [Prochlorococcus sp. AH-716-K03]